MSNIEYYNLLSLISLVMFIVLTIMAVIMWFKLDVMHYVAVLTGSEAKRSIDKIRKDAASGEVQLDRRRRNKAVVSWNTSEGLEDTPAAISHKLAAVSQAQPAAMNYDPEKTMVLGQPDAYATMVLSQIGQAGAQPQNAPYTAPAQSSSYEPAEPPVEVPVHRPAFDFIVEKEITNSADTQS